MLYNGLVKVNFYIVLGKIYYLMNDVWVYWMVGIVFWYGIKFYGQVIVNGEIYDFYGMIVVYKILLLLSYVWVINLDNGKSVIVCVNDCGLFYFDWVIDLFFVVVKKFGYVEIGIVWVKVEGIDLVQWWVQCGWLVLMVLVQFKQVVVQVVFVVVQMQVVVMVQLIEIYILLLVQYVVVVLLVQIDLKKNVLLLVDGLYFQVGVFVNLDVVELLKVKLSGVMVVLVFISLVVCNQQILYWVWLGLIGLVDEVSCIQDSICVVNFGQLMLVCFD